MARPFTLPEQIAFIEMHLRLFRNGFPTMVERKQITAERAAHDLECMGAVLATLRMLAAPKRTLPANRNHPNGVKPVTIYFADEAARQEFLNLVQSLQPAGTTLTVPAPDRGE